MSTQSSLKNHSTFSKPFSKLFKKALLASMTLVTGVGFANDVHDPKYLEIGSVTIQTKDVVMDGAKEICSACNTAEFSVQDWERHQDSLKKNREEILKKLGMLSSESSGDISFEQIINFGIKIWKLVEANKPVVSYKTETANALPQNADGNWLSLENWQAPKGKIYSVSYKNLYNVEVVKFDYRILFTSGGSLNGNGKYLSNVNVQPQNLWVAWGYNVEAAAKVVNVINTSSKANPVAGMEVLVDWRVKTVLRDMRSTTSFFMRGDGEFVDLNGTLR